MRKSTYTDEQIIQTLSDVKNGAPVEDACNALGISLSTFYVWKQRYDGMSKSHVKRSRQLEEHTARLRRQLSHELRDNRVLKAIVEEMTAAEK